MTALVKQSQMFLELRLYLKHYQISNVRSPLPSYHNTSSVASGKLLSSSLQVIGHTSVPSIMQHHL